jgi:hypothetical protein
MKKTLFFLAVLLISSCARPYDLDIEATNTSKLDICAVKEKVAVGITDIHSQKEEDQYFLALTEKGYFKDIEIDIDNAYFNKNIDTKISPFSDIKLEIVINPKVQKGASLSTILSIFTVTLFPGFSDVTSRVNIAMYYKGKFVNRYREYVEHGRTVFLWQSLEASQKSILQNALAKRICDIKKDIDLAK